MCVNINHRGKKSPQRNKPYRRHENENENENG